MSAHAALDQAHDSDQETVWHKEPRKLKTASSDVSVDSMGFPRIFGSPDKPKQRGDSVASASASAAASESAAAASAAGESVAASAAAAMQQSMRGSEVKGAKGKAKPRPEPEPKRKPGNKQAVAADDLPGKRYSRMYYKAANAYGLRQNFGEKRQVISISKKGVAKLDLQSIAERALERLHAGGDEAEVKAWVHAKLAQY